MDITEEVDTRHTTVVDATNDVISIHEKNPAHALLDAFSYQSSYDQIISIIESGIDVNLSNQSGLTALHYASASGQIVIVEMLLNRKADVNKKDSSGWTPLYYSIKEGHTGTSRILLKHGADINATYRTGMSILHIAVLYSGDYLTLNKTKLIRLLLDYNVNVNAVDPYGQTALHIACSRKYAEISGILLDNNADVNKSDNDGSTPLHIATEVNYLPIVELLVSHGANVKIIDKNGETPLGIASRHSNNEIMKGVLMQAIVTNQVQNTGKSELQRMIEDSNNLFKYLKDDLETTISKFVKFDATMNALTQTVSKYGQNGMYKKEYEEEKKKRELAESQLGEERNKRRAIEVQLEDANRKIICQICMDNTRDTILFPCSHMIYCHKCIEQLRERKCPLCNMKITSELHCMLDL